MRDAIEEFLEEKFSEFDNVEITFIGLGNPYRSDDGFGIEAAAMLKKAGLVNSFTEFDGLDGLILDLCNNNHRGLVIFFDTSDWGANPGELKIFSGAEIKDESRSHKIPLKLYMKLLEKAGKEAFLIAAQPESLENVTFPILSEKVKESLDKLTPAIVRASLPEADKPTRGG